MNVRTLVKAQAGVLSTQLDGEAVLMHVSKGIYFGLNEVGAFLWKLMAEPVAVGTLCLAVDGEFEVDAESCERDVLALMVKLGEQGLVEICGEES